MVFWNVFLESIKLPRKKSLFKLNRIGMDIVVVYLFILLLFVSIPSFIQQIKGTGAFIHDLNVFFQMIYFFIFYYLPMNIIVFILLSLIACIGVGITRLMKRKLRFAILWKMSAFSITIPFIAYMIMSLLMPVSNLFFWFAMIYIFILLIKMISIYPRRKRR